METLKITPEDCGAFPGGWSVRPEEMFVALSNTTYDKMLNVLEFGAGAGTDALVKLLKTQGVPFTYVSYENDTNYVSTSAEVQTVLWSDFPTEITGGIYDLVVIDGPAGLSRVNWYPLLKTHVRPGTILVVDDFRHFREFLIALNATFRHQIIAEHTEIPVKNQPYVTWMITRVIEVK